MMLVNLDSFAPGCPTALSVHPCPLPTGDKAI